MITGYFEDREIEWFPEGTKNVSKGWIGLKCIYCDDHSNHLGVELATGRVSCWLCGSHGKIINLLVELEQCSYRQAKVLLDNWWEGDFDETGLTKLPPSYPAPERVALPPIIKQWPQKYLDYLQGRGYNPHQLIKKYRLMPAHRFGHYGFRIIVPFFVAQKLVTFTTLDITGKKESKYKDCSKKDSVIPTDECLYNIDKVRGEKVVIVEGVTDVWRIGDGAVAVNTNKISDRQLLQLTEKGIKKALVMLDADAVSYAEKMWSLIAGTMTIEVDLAHLDRDDPDKMTHIEWLKVRKWLS